ncbi:hypothetical protein [Paenibacillus brasilensis]|uniref:Flap endonuclease-1-like 5' DNA nuclease n=1 Tax=Paenibacillus brasilensis TaxID=128574 RepID=A0ABU0KUB8_9BACL|nr:hypothetical protein [Paenibacillus brasilensis]MDQ0492975.1 putative flap endonuclease-1-like 5' DNA nuclease [Paenibacillus brasilensis]
MKKYRLYLIKIAKNFEQSVSSPSSTNDTASLEKRRAQLEAQIAQQSSQSSSTSTTKVEKSVPSNTEAPRSNNDSTSDIAGIGKQLDISVKPFVTTHISSVGALDKK